jgi:hypothetical protein
VTIDDCSVVDLDEYPITTFALEVYGSVLPWADDERECIYTLKGLDKQTEVLWQIRI